ncbi:MAG TPA: hypothetical protein VKN63_04905 [Afifellaceae bacterium]|nr:hypothetical protein [Afifellaceae bacterium]
MSRAKTPLGAFVVGSLVFLASFSNYLNYNAYPVFTPETGLVVVTLLALCALAALIYRNTGKYGRLALVGLLVLLAFDLNVDTRYALIAVAVHFLLLRDFTLPILGIMAVTALAGNVIELASGRPPEVGTVVMAEGAEPGQAGRPAIVHVVLDAHTGVEGLDRSDETQSPIAEDISRFYEANGFRLFGGAYSVHRRTVNAIPAILNDNRDFPLLGPAKRLDWTTNHYFASLIDRGYRLSVFQTDLIDYCVSAKVAFCKTYAGADPRPLIRSPLSTVDKSVVLLSQFARLSQTLLYAAAIYDAFGLRLAAHGVPFEPFMLYEKAGTSALVANAALDDLVAAAGDAKPGEAYFAHVLLPHEPFLLERDCSYNGPFDWQYERSEVATIAQRQHAFGEQVGCVQRKLQAMLDALKTSDAGGNAIIILHGDHGSRITEVEPLVENEGRYSDVDLISSYSTLFAVRAPDIEPGYDGRPFPAHALLAEFLTSDFKSLNGQFGPHDRHIVNLENRDWVTVGERELPQGWAGR